MKSGDVILLDFPFSDLSGSKSRPAVIVANAGGNDFVACQVTRNATIDADAIQLSAESFSAGGLRVVSFVRPGKLFTANRIVITKLIGRVTDLVKNQIKEAVVKVIRRE